MRTADFYLGIAQNALEQLGAVEGGIEIGTSSQSDHFSHAVIATVFSAFAVEHAMTQLIWIECFLLTPAPHRDKTALLASKLRSIPDKVEYLKNAGIDRAILKDIGDLFERRNGLVHLRKSDVVTHDGGTLDFDDVKKINDVGRGPELDQANELAISHDDFSALDRLANEFGTHRTQLLFPGLSTEVIDQAYENVAIAEAALKVLNEMHTVREGGMPED